MRIGAEPEPAVTFRVKVVVRPAVGVVVGPVRVIVGTATAVTFAVPVLVPAVTVTVAVWLVVSVVCAWPVEFVVPITGATEPWSVVNDTGTPARPLLLLSSTLAVMVAVPPSCETLEGLAVTTTVVAAAAPITIETPDPVVVVGAAPVPVEAEPDVELEPENALMTAVPDCEPALKMTVALLFDVATSVGVTVPSEVVKVTIVPFCTGLPPLSSTLAVISAVPLIGRTCAFVYSLIVVPVGAKRGTLSHATSSATAASTITGTTRRRRARRVGPPITPCRRRSDIMGIV